MLKSFTKYGAIFKGKVFYTVPAVIKISKIISNSFGRVSKTGSVSV